jgi:PPOX class probable F420-dependent enzyme
VVIDPTTEKGARVAQWLREDIVAWLVTVTPDGTPVPTPIWFWWDGESILIYSQRAKPKLRHIASNPRVALALTVNEVGDLRAVLTGNAAVDETAPGADELPEYIDKYRDEIARLESDPTQFAAEYSVAIRMTPTKLRAW